MIRKLPIKTTWITWFLIFALGFSVAACSSPEQRARAHYESGKALLETGEYVKAGLEFRNAIKFNSKLAVAWDGLASVDEKAQNWPAVIDDLQQVIELDKKNSEARLKLAKLQLASGKLDLALKNVNDANDLKKDDTDILAMRAAILFRLNDREGARAEAEHALARNPDNPDALAILAADQLTDKNYVLALQFIDRGLFKDPKNLGLLMFKVKIYEDQKDDPKLEGVLRTIIAAYPEKKELRQALIAFMMSRNRSADVEAELRGMIAADPKDTAQALTLVNFLAATKGPAEARTELNHLISANPDVADYKFALAQLDFSEKKSDVAKTALAAIIAKGEPKADVQRAQLLLASIHTQLQEVDKAKALIKDVLAADEKNADALTMRATISLDAGDLDNAVGDLREALNQQPNSIALLMLLGRALERQGAVELANERLAQALKISNSAPQVALDYIAFLGRRNRVGDAERVLDDAVAHNPNDTRLLQALAQLRVKKQDWVGAQQAAEALKKAGDKSGMSEQISGAVLLGQKKYEEGIDTFKGAYASAPNAVQPMYDLFMAYMQAGKTSDAENFLKSILAVNEKNADALVLLGSLQSMQKQPKEAEATFKLAIERQPASPAGYLALAKHYASLKQIPEAEAILKVGHEKAPPNLALNLALANLFERKNDIEGAITIYEEQIKSTPDALIIINNLASLLADYRTDAASLDRASQLSGRLEAIDVPSFKDTVGWVAYRRGDFGRALSNLEKAAEKLPDLAIVKYHLGMTYLALKRNVDAKAQFAKAESLLKDGDPLKEKIRAAISASN